MSLEDQIRDLERQSRVEMRNMTLLFARTKREIRKQLSPDRMIRKNVGGAMLLAAFGAMVLAPAPKYPAKNGNAAPVRLPWLRSIRGILPRSLRNVVRRDDVNGTPSNAPPADPKRAKNLIELLLGLLLSQAAQRINWATLAQHIMERFLAARRGRAEPSVGVANVGTTPTDQNLDGDIQSP